jgi:predicted outer membrane repeat protein
LTWIKEIAMMLNIILAWLSLRDVLMQPLSLGLCCHGRWFAAIYARPAFPPRGGKTCRISDEGMKKNSLLHVWIILAMLLSSLGVFQVAAGIPARSLVGDVSLGNILYVKPDLETNGTCSSWVDACDLQTALENAVEGDEIWVAAGKHYPGPEGASRDVSFSLKNGVALYGGFIGTEIARQQRNWDANPTILSGDIDRNGDFLPVDDLVGNAYHVVTSIGLTSTAVLDGFGIRAGHASGVDFSAQLGGGMYNVDSSPTLANLSFYGNSADYGGGGGMANTGSSSPLLINVSFSSNTASNGGGMYNVDSNPTLTDVHFSYNTATGNGGGMFNLWSNPTLIDVTFDENTAYNGGGMFNGMNNPILTNVTFLLNKAIGRGGGMYNNENSSPILTWVDFYSNTAQISGGGMGNEENSNPTLTNVYFGINSADYGGGMYTSDSSPTLNKVTFDLNSANNGGGMYNVGGNPTLSDVTFSRNTGGGMVNHVGNSTLTNVIFSDNTASHGGGMANSEASNSTLTNVIFLANSANNGGGMYNGGGSSTLTNVTFYGNTAESFGGGIYSGWGCSTLTNVILWGNAAPSNSQVCCLPGITSITYSIVQGGYPGSGNLDADPRFVGGIRQDLHLQYDSPAIDAGNNNAVPKVVLTDLDGNPRFADIPFVFDAGIGEGPIVDMGAYELQLFTLYLPLYLPVLTK